MPIQKETVTFDTVVTPEFSAVAIAVIMASILGAVTLYMRKGIEKIICRNCNVKSSKVGNTLQRYRNSSCGRHHSFSIQPNPGDDVFSAYGR